MRTVGFIPEKPVKPKIEKKTAEKPVNADDKPDDKSGNGKQ